MGQQPQLSSDGNNRGSVPVPDPTVLTTEQTQREISQLREIIETRLVGMDRAIDLLQRFADKSPTTENLQEKIVALKELMDEKFKGVATQFSERDTRVEQTSRDAKLAIDAALQTQKEAVGKQNDANNLAISKSEAAFTKQIDSLSELLKTATNALNEKIDDVKQRQNLIAGQTQGIGLSAGVVVGMIAAAAAIAAIIVAVLK